MSHAAVDEHTRLTQVQEQLESIGQAHVLRSVDELAPKQRRHLLDELDSIDLQQLARLIETHVRQRPAMHVPADLGPAPYYQRDGAATDLHHYAEAGETIIRGGEMAAFTVAGGQGTRLGWNGPKGSYPATPVTGKPLFAVFAEQIRAAQQRYGVTIPWYIMTSPINDAATRDFFRDNNNFGLVRSNIFMFPQGMMPAFDLHTARMLMEAPHSLALNPDGHGGSIKALRDSGAIEDMQSRGIAHISYFQVDNPLVRVIDPAFIGLHATAPDSSGEISSKMVPKQYPDEKLGVFCSSSGKTIVIEYSDLPTELAQQVDERGQLRFRAGNLAVHLLGVGFVQQLTADAAHFGLPYHRAEKKVPHIDIETGEFIEPDQPNAIKLETFVFDAIPLAGQSIIYETSRASEFAPIKNADGADSPATSRQIQSDYYGSWLEQHGIHVPRDPQGQVNARIEISPLSALGPEDLRGMDLPLSVEADDDLAL